MIAMTKARIVEATFDEDDLIDIAQGKNGEHRSFKGYEVIRVEQDDESMMINLVIFRILIGVFHNR